MHLIYFKMDRSDTSRDAEHAEVTQNLERVARSTDGFVDWRGGDDGLHSWGMVIFSDQAGHDRFKEDPAAGELEMKVKSNLYESFIWEGFEQVPKPVH